MKKADEAEDDSEGGAHTSVTTIGLKAEERCEDWIIHSGENPHMTFQKELLCDYREFKTPQSVGLRDGHTIETLGASRVKITTKIHGGKKIPGWITNVLYVSKLAGNLFSVHAAAQNQKVISFGHKYCWIHDMKFQPSGTGSTVEKLYEREEFRLLESQNSEIELWHQKLAHANYSQLHQLEKDVVGLSLPCERKQRFCKACIQGKMHRTPHKLLKEIKSTEKLQLGHMDICGPMQTKSFGEVANLLYHIKAGC